MRKILFAIILLVLASCARNPVTGKKEVMLMSESQEQAMGLESDPSIVQEYGLYQDAKLQTFINTKGKEMASISHRKDLPFEFKILDSPIVNAFAVPGGYVYFTRGIMAHFNNEAEFAGVLGHEIGHVTARHTAKQYSKQMLAQVLMIGGMVVSPTFAQFADLANTGLSLLFLKYSRGHESESDRLGVHYSTEVGYDSHEMAGFFKTLSKLSEGSGSIPSFMSTHPDPGDRFVNVNAHTDDIHKANGVDKSKLKINRNSYLQMIDGILYGDDPKQGYFENGVFYHPVMKFQFKTPAQWQTANSPAQVQMASADGKAAMFLQEGDAATLDAAANTFAQKNNITIEDRSSTTVNGIPAIAILGTHNPPKDQNGQATGQQLKVVAYFYQIGGGVLKMVGISAPADFNANFNTFISTMKTMAPLNDPAKINKLPERIKIVTVPRTATLQSVLTSLGVPQTRLNELSILNGMELTESVEAGTLIKVIESRA
jgi:predicted Zn-dependent protease